MLPGLLSPPPNCSPSVVYLAAGRVNKEYPSPFFTYFTPVPRHLLQSNKQRESEQLGQKWKMLSSAETDVIVM